MLSSDFWVGFSASLKEHAGSPKNLPIFGVLVASYATEKRWKRCQKGLITCKKSMLHLYLWNELRSNDRFGSNTQYSFHIPNFPRSHRTITALLPHYYQTITALFVTYIEARRKTNTDNMYAKRGFHSRSLLIFIDNLLIDYWMNFLPFLITTPL